MAYGLGTSVLIPHSPPSCLLSSCTQPPMLLPLPGSHPLSHVLVPFGDPLSELLSPLNLQLAQGAWDTPFNSANTSLHLMYAKLRTEETSGLAKEGDGGQSLQGNHRATLGAVRLWGGWSKWGHHGQEAALPADGVVGRAQGDLNVSGKVGVLCQGQREL